ncbi:ribose 5-phosphate isomerase B [Heliophilum fasciatum]|uniref:Ribose-5-phosphate isomerase n=1 Tax=Heliophilum fasciatum TaxID=35700 RepID=A0A4R2RMK2_9FIRM|nr:ribose 5-phosphate isomerase B [Heliophilum fasciatum]MCW2277487.1 ribose 5-phosphate isomerase B [Heliophilum fasciatum]TCP65222.1 ribose-5-phosphate isomerase [Heliophilum fasciatum]
MRIAIASDHGGFRLKEEVKGFLQGLQNADADGGSLEIIDLGTDSEQSVDYPDYGEKVARAVAAGDYDRGIVVCGTGIGISIAANKIAGIRAALCHEPYSARMAREHNDANVLALGGRVTGPELAREIVQAFVTTEFAGGRHAKRLDKIAALER